MLFDRLAQRSALHVRIDELERRLALLEDRVPDPTPDASGMPSEPDRRASDERRFGRRTTDRLARTATFEDAGTGLEGARLIALEMLEAGHPAERVVTYLRDSFGLEESAASLAVQISPPDLPPPARSRSAQD